MRLVVSPHRARRSAIETPTDAAGHPVREGSATTRDAPATARIREFRVKFSC